MVVATLPAGSVTSRNRQSSEPDLVHDHVRLRQHQIGAIASTVVRIRARHMEHTGTTDGRETVGGSSCSGELSSGRRSTKMIGDGCTYANRKVLVKRIVENLLPTAQACRLWRPGPSVAAPGTGNGHIALFGHRIPGHALVTQLHDLIGGGGMCGSAASHGDAGTTQLIADRARREIQLGTDLAQGPALGVQVRRTLNVHARHRNEYSGSHELPSCPVRKVFLSDLVSSSTSDPSGVRKFVDVHQRNAAEPIKGLTCCCKFTLVERVIGVNYGGL
jgi:hypothetical protein